LHPIFSREDKWFPAAEKKEAAAEKKPAKKKP